MSFFILHWLVSKFKSKPAEQKLLPKNDLVNFELSEEQAVQVREIFECALRSENAETGSQECLGCGVATDQPVQHETGCIVTLMLGMLPPEKEIPEVCPHCGSDQE